MQRGTQNVGLDLALCFGSLNCLQFNAAEMNRLPLRRPRGRDSSPDVMTSKNSAWSQKRLLPLNALFSIKHLMHVSFCLLCGKRANSFYLFALHMRERGANAFIRGPAENFSGWTFWRGPPEWTYPSHTHIPDLQTVKSIFTLGRHGAFERTVTARRCSAPIGRWRGDHLHQLFKANRGKVCVFVRGHL